MSMAIFLDLVLAVLLAAAIVQCVLVERRLKALRSGQEGLKATIVELNAAIAAAGESVRMLRASADGATRKLDQGIASARALADELSILNSAGERIARRIESGTATAPLPGPQRRALNELRAVR